MPADFPLFTLPAQMPYGPVQSHAPETWFGNAQSDAARDMAKNTRVVLKGNYDEANAHHDDDVVRYIADNDLWNQRKVAMQIDSPADYQACWTYIQAMYQKGDDAYHQLMSCLEHVNAGDVDVDQGDASSSVPVKIQKYNAATAQYNAGSSCVTVANTDHTAFVSNANSFEAIIVNYG